MPELTPRLGIKKPTGSNHVNRVSLNENWDIIDANAETIAGAQSKADAAETNAKNHADQKIGNIANLDTQDKTNLVNAINELFQNVSDGKITIADAIADMNQSAAGNMTFAQLAAAILAISTDANAASSEVLNGRSFYQGGQKRTGTMPNRSNVNQTLTSQNQTYTVPSGYHAGSGTVKANISNLTSENVRSGANVGGVSGTFSSYSNGATASQILTGRSAAVNGSTVNGSMPNRSGNVNAQSRSRSGTTLRLRPPEGYFNGNTSNSVQTSDSNWVASNIRANVPIFGLTGSLVEREFATGNAIGSTQPMTGVVGQRPLIKVTGLTFQPRVIIAQRRNSPGVVTVFIDSSLNGRETATTVVRVDPPLIETSRTSTGSGGVFVYTNSSGFEITIGNVNENATFDWIAFR